MEQSLSTGKFNTWLRTNRAILCICAGPALHLGYLFYVLGRNIISIASYAEMSIAMPLAFLIILTAMLGLLTVQPHRRNARMGTLLMAVIYIVFAIAMPWIEFGFNITRLLVPSPWIVRPEISAVWTLIAYLGIGAYGLSVWGIIEVEWKERNPKTAVFSPAIVKLEGSHHKIRYKGTLVVLGSLIVGLLLITGNQMWYTHTYRLHYDAAPDMGLEYWLGVDEQEYNGVFTVVNATPIVEGADVQIPLTQLRTLPDQFFAVRFLIDNTTHIHWGYNTWYFVSHNFDTLYLTDISASLALRLQKAVNGSMPLNMTCVGYTQSRLTALQQTHAVIVLAGGLGVSVPQNYTNNTPEFNATCWLYSQYGIRIQAPHGCGIGFLQDYDMLRDELLRWQDTRVNGPSYYRTVIEGAMYDVERIDQSERFPMAEQYINQTLGWNRTIEKKNTWEEWYWGQNSLNESEYWAYINKWNTLIDWLYDNITWPNGTQDPSLRFKLINCGQQDNLLDYFDHDPDVAVFMHNLGYGTHFAVDGYMFYRGGSEPYWTYGYVNLLSMKPKVVPHEEPLVLLGCMNTDPYRYDYPLEPGSRFRVDRGAVGDGSDGGDGGDGGDRGKEDDWTRDVNGDGLENGFDALVLDILMCGAKGIRRVNLWPGPGPRSPSCCDYREFPRALLPGKDFFIELAGILNRSWDLEFAFLPGNEHFWDKEILDIMMDLKHPKGLAVLGIGALFYTGFVLKNLHYIRKIQMLRKAEEPKADGQLTK